MTAASPRNTSVTVITGITAPDPIDLVKIRSVGTASNRDICIYQLFIDGTSSGLIGAKPHVTGTRTGGPIFSSLNCGVASRPFPCFSPDTFFLYDYDLPPMITGDLVVETCDIIYAGTTGTLNWVYFPEYPWMGSSNFENSNLNRASTHTVISNILVPSDVAAVRIAGLSDRLCLSSVSIAGKVAQTGVPIWLDSNCQSTTFGDVPCVPDQSFAVTSPASVITATVDIQVKTCPGPGAESLNKNFTVSFPSNTGFTSFSFDTAPSVPDALQTVASGVAVPWPLSTVLITAESTDAVCIENLYINGVENINSEYAFIDGICEATEHDAGALGNLPCRQDSELFIFTPVDQPLPTTVPTIAPTAGEVAPIIIQSEHPYTQWNVEKWIVAIPGASCYLLNMDSRSWTPDRYNYVRIFGVRGDKSLEQFPGATKKRLYKHRLADYVGVRIENFGALEIQHRTNGGRAS